MANPEHLAILKQGVEAWNAWREEHSGQKPDLSGSALQGASLRRVNFNRANLESVNLQHSDLTAARFLGANLSYAQIVKAALPAARMARANLYRANLAGCRAVGANFYDGNLSRTFLKGCDLRRANLTRANLAAARVAGANFASARLDQTILIGVDLWRADGLEAVHHCGPSALDIETLIASQGRIPVSFLEGIGTPSIVIEQLPSLAAEGVEFFSSFISYSHADKPFARRLHDQLQARGIRCWLDEKKLKPGDRILDVVDGAIRLHDKLLICCSKASLDNSWWVKDEIRKAQGRERKEDRAIIIPLNLDGYLFEWQDGLASDLTSRLAADFTGWAEDNAKFEAEFARVVEALRAREKRVRSDMES